MPFDENRNTQEILTRLAVQLRDMSVLLSEQRERIAEELTQIRRRLAHFRNRHGTPPAENEKAPEPIDVVTRSRTST